MDDSDLIHTVPSGGEQCIIKIASKRERLTDNIIGC